MQEALFPLSFYDLEGLHAVMLGFSSTVDTFMT